MTEQSGDAVLRIALVLLLFIFAGCAGAPTTSSPADTEPTIEASWRCQDHESVGGERVQECVADIDVDDMGDAAFVEVRSINGVGGETSIRTITEADETILGDVKVVDSGTGRLIYGDTVLVSAVFPNGNRTVLSEHEFTCEDVKYKDACGDSNGS